METLTVSRNQDLLERAAMYRHTQIFLPDADDYVRGLLHKPIGFKENAYGKEPIVDVQDLYDLGDSAWLTVNGDNALVLNTRNLLIADTTFGDPRLDRHAGAKDVNEVCKNLNELHLLDDDLETWQTNLIVFADQSYRVYRTDSGCRVICTSIAVPWQDMAWEVQGFMQFLRSDPRHIQACEATQCYRAGLTLNEWHDNNGDVCVCRLEETHGDDCVHPDLKEQLRLHDELIPTDAEDSRLA